MARARSRSETQEFLREARERFQQGQEAVHNQRKRELEDLAFYEGGKHQWDPDTWNARKAQQGGGIDGLPPVPARPCLTINKVREPVHQVLNQERQSEMGIELVPADDFAAFVGTLAEEEIELREGLVRRIQRDSAAMDARTWAFDRAVKAGIGFYVVRTRYVPGKTRNQEVYVSRLFNQASVTLDPAHEQPDGSDADWGFIGSDMPWGRYKVEHKKAADGTKNPHVNADDSTFRALGEEYPGWFKQTGDQRSARVVEYFYTVRETRTVIQLVDGTDAWKDEVEDQSLYALDEDGNILEEHEDIQKKIKWAKIDATQILEETDWPGPDMPIIKVLGEEMQPHDAERRAEGMIRQARDPGQGFNAAFSKFIEMIGLTPMSSLALAEGQWDGYEQWYQLASTRTLPFMPFRKFNDAGQDLGEPRTVDRNTPIQPLAAAVQMLDEAIKSTTMVPSVQLGRSDDPAIKTKGGINSLIEQGQLGTSHFLDNMKRSVRYEGQIINNLLYPIYGRRPGRLTRIVTGENEAQDVRIGTPSNGQANLPAMPPPTQGMGGPHPLATASMGAPGVSGNGAGPKTYTLTPDANFNVMVKVVRNFDSRRAEESSTIGQLLTSNPQLMAVFGDLFFANQDGPGHQEMAERAKVMLDPKVQQMLQAKEQNQGGDPQAQAQIAALTKQLNDAHGVMAQAQKELKDKTEAHQRELEMKRQIADADRQWEREKLEKELAAKIEIAHISAAHAHIGDIREDTEEAIALGREQAHEATQAELDRQHERDQADRGHQQALEQGAQGHEQALEQGAQPPPINPNQQPAPAGE